MANTITLATEKGSATTTMEEFRGTVNRITGEIKDHARQGSIAALANVERYSNYRVQVTVTTEVTVRCHDETEAAETGVADIDAGCGEVIKRQVAVTYLRPKD